MPERQIEADPNPLLTIGEVADLFKVSVRTVHRYIASGQLEVVRLPGGQARVRRSAVDAALTDSAVGMTAPKFVLADPPETDGNGGGNSNPVYEHFAAFLRAHPDQWAEWPHAFYSNERATNTAAAIRRGSYIALRGGYEVVSRDRVVYVRYTGKPAQNRLDTIRKGILPNER